MAKITLDHAEDIATKSASALEHASSLLAMVLGIIATLKAAKAGTAPQG